MALLWAIIGGALIGGAAMTIEVIVDSGGQIVLEKPLALLFGPVAIGAFSLFVVIPCTLVFGLPSVALIHHLNLSRWPALAVCIASAVATQIACIRLVFWDEWSTADQFGFTIPFALGAAAVLWWRMTRAKG